MIAYAGGAKAQRTFGAECQQTYRDECDLFKNKKALKILDVGKVSLTNQGTTPWFFVSFFIFAELSLTFQDCF